MNKGIKSYGFIGGGNMGEALIRGLMASGHGEAHDIMVAEPDAERRRFLHETYGVAVEDDNRAVIRQAKTVVLAVKPQIIERVLNEIAPENFSGRLIISIAAGVKTARIEALLPQGTPVIRAMPNTPALVLKGATAITAGKSASPEHLNLARNLFNAVGLTVQIEEKNMDAVTGLSGSGPAYVFIILEALTDAGVLQGLSREQAFSLAAQTIYGSAALALEPGAHPGRLKDMVTSPGGTTITGLRILERGGLRGLIMDAVAAAAKRSAEL